MGIFKPISVIKYEGDNSTFIYKHPSEDFNTMSQLIVHESQEAIFFMNGQALDMFGPGRYTLSTQNIPLLNKMLKGLTDSKKSFFHCEVYFINKTTQMSLKWGTDSRVRFIEPNLGVPLDIGASGELNLKVQDSRKLLVKVVGTMKGIAWDQQGAGFTKSIKDSFRPLISTAIKSKLAKTIKNEKIDILEIDEHLSELSQALKKEILPGFEEYGLTIPNFYVSNVLLPEDDPKFKEIRELHALSFDVKMREATRAKLLAEETTKTEISKFEAQRKLIDESAKAESLRMRGIAEADVMHAQGYDKKDEFSRDVQIAYAQGIGNMGSKGGGGGSHMSDIIGLGVGLAAMGNVAKQAGAAMNDLNNPNAIREKSQASASGVKCPKCGHDNAPGVKFCSECGTKLGSASQDEIICPHCGKKTKNGKFCNECGAPLIAKCPKCGHENAPGTKFCNECGTKLV